MAKISPLLPKREKPLTIRLTDREREHVELSAIARDMTLSAYVRHSLKLPGRARK